MIFRVMRKNFSLEEWFKDKNRKVVDDEGNEVKIVFCPMFMMLNGEIAGTYQVFKKGKSGIVLTEGEKSNLFFE